MQRIGIMGGTFNPIHNGHIAIAQAAYEQYSLDKVWFMPNHIPAYKNHKYLISATDRMNMIKLAIQDYSYFDSSDFELTRRGNTYTAETMKLLNIEYPDTKFYFIMGMDSLLYFDKWKNPEEIIKYCTILSAPRDHTSIEKMTSRINELCQMFGPNHFFSISCDEVRCSSSEIREEIHKLYQLTSNKKECVSNTTFLTNEVKKYILEHRLYSDQI